VKENGVEVGGGKRALLQSENEGGARRWASERKIKLAKNQPRTELLGLKKNAEKGGETK